MNNLKIDPYGAKRGYDDQGKLHRDDNLPAVAWNNGDKIYYFHGKSHRTFGPAMERNGDNDNYWYWLGKKIKDEN